MLIDELITGCKQNNQKSYNELYTTFKPILLCTIKKYIKDDDTIEELTQESFIKIFKNIKNYNNIGSFKSWVIMIGRNTAIDYIRKYQNEYGLIDNLHLSYNPELDYDYDIITNINYNLIKQVINELPKAYKNAIELYAIQNYKHKEIAEMLGITESTSKTNLFKAKNKIKTMLNDKFEYIN